MSRAETQKANMKKRWAGNEGRPGVEACNHTGSGGWNRECLRYAVVTSSKRTEHDSFDEAREEYRMRRVSALTPTGVGVRETSG